MNRKITLIQHVLLIALAAWIGSGWLGPAALASVSQPVVLHAAGQGNPWSDSHDSTLPPTARASTTQPAQDLEEGPIHLLSLQEPDEQSQGPCSSGCNRRYGNGLNAGDPIATNNGAYHFDLPLLALGGPMNLGFTPRYRSNFEQIIYWRDIGVPIRFWWSPFEYLEWGFSQFAKYVTVQVANGDAISFEWKTDHWEPGAPFVPGAYPVPWSLKETDGYFYLMDPLGEQVHIFKKSNWVGRIERIVDRNGNQLIYSYAGATDLYPSHIEDGLGRSLDFTYQDIGGNTALVRVTDQAGRHVNLTYDEHGADNENVWTLRAVTDATGQTTTFHYTWTERADHLVKWHHQITGVERPAGNAPYTQAYANQKLNGVNASRVVSQTDAYSHTTAFVYDPTAIKVAEHRPDGTVQTYEHHDFYSPPRSLTDPTGKTMQFGWDEDRNRLISVTDRLGDTTQVTYHPETGKIASYTDAEGHTTTFTYTAQDQTFTNPANGETVTFTFYNLTHTDYPDGTHEDYAYDAHGNILTYSDGLGNEWHYTYNSRGQLLTITNPNGGVTTYAYNADGTLASSTDADVGVTTYAYDGYKRLDTITYPGGATVHFTYDLNDRLLTLTDELGRVLTFTYDNNGNLLTVTDPLGRTYTYAYDLMDRLSGFTDPLGHSAAFTYDKMGRMASFTDRNGHTTTYAYDPRGWLNAITDAAGHIWTSTYDDEGVLTATTTPLGHTTSVQTDKLGRTVTITDPLGAATHFSYDALGRLTSTTDRVGRTTAYTYDDAGRLTSVTRAGLGTATYTRNNLGLLTRITDLQGQHWDFGYSAVGRLTSHTDPLGNQWTYAYDERGRLQQTTYPDGSSTTYTYDAADQVVQIAYPGGPTLDFTYDDAGQLLTANDIAFTRDARGDITASRDGSASFGATYDDGQRLKTVTYDGQATVTYTYDERDLLTRVEDDLSGAWMTFAYDDDGRLTQIRRSNGVSTTYTYDAADRVTRIQDARANGSLADQQYTFNAEGEPTQVVRTLPLDPPPSLPSLNLTYDEAGQIASPGYAYDARGRQTAAPGKQFTYDGASRLISVAADGATATFTYNGLGDLRTRTADGATTHYYHNYALGLWPIVAERQGSSGSWLRYYVYTPGGRLLYMIDPQDSNRVYFYHFDDIGSTLFLTNAGGAVTDSYAYTPYGQLLDHNGSNPQPFTFVGELGVRQEGPSGTFYHMRARYYDAETAQFISRDPVWPMIADIESLNPYQYAGENPVSFVDPEGHFFAAIGSWIARQIARVAVKFAASEAVEHTTGKPLPLSPLTAVEYAGGPGDTLPTIPRRNIEKVNKRLSEMRKFEHVLYQEAMKNYIIQQSVGGSRCKPLTREEKKLLVPSGLEHLQFFRSRLGVIFGVGPTKKNLQETIFVFQHPEKIRAYHYGRAGYSRYFYEWSAYAVKDLLPGVYNADAIRYQPFRHTSYSIREAQEKIEVIEVIIEGKIVWKRE